MSVTVGQFLYDKTKNMQKWLREEGIEHTITSREFTQAECTLIAERIRDCNEKSRNFSKLKEHTNLDSVTSLVHMIEPRADLHDKFWRYLELFRDTVKE